jgi:hypothetical protein
MPLSRTTLPDNCASLHSTDIRPACKDNNHSQCNRKLPFALKGELLQPQVQSLDGHSSNVGVDHSFVLRLEREVFLRMR